MGENSVCNFSQLGPQGFTYHPVAMQFLNDITVASQALHTERGAETSSATAPARPAGTAAAPDPSGPRCPAKREERACEQSGRDAGGMLEGRARVPTRVLRFISPNFSTFFFHSQQMKGRTDDNNFPAAEQ